MSALLSILIFAISLPLALLCFVSAAMGIRKHRVYVGPSLPPIPIDTRPIAFVGLCVFYFGSGIFFLAFAIIVALKAFAIL
jgi:hypothetical protein